MTIHEVVKKLVGPIYPKGETNTDNERFENLKTMTRLVDLLVTNITNVASEANSPEYSVKRAGEFASRFLTKDLGMLESGE